MASTKKVEVKDGEKLLIRVPKGKLAAFKWNGVRDYEVVLVDI